MKTRNTLRWRLLILLSLGITGFWLLIAPWLLQGVRHEVQKSLDDRLAASARMVASLVQRQQLSGQQWDTTNTAKAAAAHPFFPSTLACRISTLSGEVVALSQDAPADVLDEVKDGYSLREVDGQAWRVYSTTVGGLRVSTADRLSTRDSLMTSVTLAAAVPFFLALAGTLVLVWFAVRRSFAPLERLSDAVSKRDLQDTTALQWDEKPAEVKPLVDEINRLLERVGQTIMRERQFTGDAAHELRTPLTAIKTQLQVAQLAEGNQSRHAMAQAERALERLQGTLDQLLLLAQVEGNTAFSEPVSLPIEEIAQLAVVEVATRASRKKVDIALQAKSEARLAIPTSLAVASLRNLLDNAVRVSPEGTQVELTVCVEADSVVFIVGDDGPGVPPEKLAQLTRRFVRLGEGDNGLGLAIVENIADRFGGSLTLSNRGPHGFEARLRLPLANTEVTEP